MSAVSNSVMPRSIAFWITFREVSRSVRWPKLLQPRPTAETRRPEPPRLRICMEYPVGRDGNGCHIVTRPLLARKARALRPEAENLRRDAPEKNAAPVRRGD